MNKERKSNSYQKNFTPLSSRIESLKKEKEPKTSKKTFKVDESFHNFIDELLGDTKKPITATQYNVEISKENGTNNLSNISSDNDSVLDLDDQNPKIHFQLISIATISIEFDPTDAMTEECENIIVKNGAYFQKELGIWLAPFKQYPSLYTSLTKLNSKFSVKKIPDIALRAFNESSYTKIEFILKKKDIILDYSDDEKNKKSIESLPRNLKQSLYPFQKEGIQFGIEKHCRILLADEMGVGKTVQAISLSYLYRENWPVLIVCPGSVKYSWRNEINRWLGIKEKYIHIINKSKESLSSKAKYFIISYDLVRRIYKKLTKKNFEFVILDESHNIKNKDAQRSFYIIPIAQKAKRLILLSGTPILSRPLEGFTSLSCLRPDIFKEFVTYGRRYCDPKLTRFGVQWSGASNTKELHFILNTLMIRRLKKDVLSQLPPKRRMKIEIECEKESLDKIKSQYNKNSSSKLTMPDIYRLTGEAKIKGIKGYVNDLIEADMKFIIFAHHHNVLNAIEKIVSKKGIEYIRIDGHTVGQARFDKVNEFQTNDNCKVAILSIMASSTGITLTAASIVVFAELTWTPALMIQAEDRAHRIGQNGNYVDIAYLYGRDTLDEYIFARLSKKLNIVSTTLDDRQAEMEFGKGKEKEKEKKEEKEESEDEGSKEKNSKGEIESASTEIGTYDLNLHEDKEKRRRENFISIVDDLEEKFNAKISKTGF